MAVGELFQEAPEAGASCIFKSKRSDIEHSAMERVPILDQEVEHTSGSARFDGQTAEAHVTGNH